jgi:hypothetical protein
MQTSLVKQPLTDSNFRVKYMYDWNSEMSHYYEQQGLYHMDMAKHIEILRDSFLKIKIE